MTNTSNGELIAWATQQAVSAAAWAKVDLADVSAGVFKGLVNVTIQGSADNGMSGVEAEAVAEYFLRRGFRKRIFEMTSQKSLELTGPAGVFGIIFEVRR